jgi:glutamate 5-kinase
LRLDAGAVVALRAGKSLLPVGLIEVVGDFRRGDAVTLVDADGAELGKGLAAYSSDEANSIRGKHSDQIESILGYRGRSVMVHRDDLVWFDGNSNA